MHRFLMTTATIINPSEQPLVPVISGIWGRPATIEINGFKFKSLSNFAYNPDVDWRIPEAHETEKC